MSHEYLFKGTFSIALIATFYIILDVANSRFEDIKKRFNKKSDLQKLKLSRAVRGYSFLMPGSRVG